MGKSCPGKGGFDDLKCHAQHARQAYLPVVSWMQDAGIIVERTFLQFPKENDNL
jgi:hypothetical protein